MTWPGALVCLVLRHHLCPSSWLVFLRVRGQPPESTCLDHFQVRFCWPSSLQACLPPEQARFTRDHRYVPYTGIRHWWYCDCDCTVLLIFTFLGPFFFQHHAQQIRQTSGSSAHDSICNKAMCIEANVEGDTARYVLRSTGDQQLGWMAMGFGHVMRDSAMVIMWPTRDEEGSYASVTLSQRKAPYETMPTLDPDPPFIATLELSQTSVTGDNPQMAFTRPAPPDGIQHIIWAFSRTPPESADEDSQSRSITGTDPAYST
ncbi:hypothetical protein BGY98DRAFT_45327 [Russula aff. rugulosa BPL654]|nr:hypothetical protein BGY98DRAFT_45327 [Russula aff. rugulosa BPL654]